MKFEKEDNTKIRFEKDGIYVMNSKYQTKEKITDLENEGRLLYEAIHCKEIQDIGTISRFVKKKFIIPITEYEDKFKNKNKKYTSAPIYMTLGITSGCNYHCKHCGNNSVKKKDTDLNKEEIYNLLDQMIEMKLLKLNFTGGEPTTNNNLIDYIRYVKDKIPRLTITTNGSLITEQKALLLKNAGIDMAKISIDGLENFHDSFRNYKSAYKSAINAIKCFKKYEIEVRVQSTLTKYNTHDLLELMEILSNLEITHQTIVPVCPIGRADKNMMLEKEGYKDFITQMYNKVIELNKKKCITNFQIRPVFGATELFNKLKRTEFETLSMQYSCEALKNTMEIQPNGDVVPCSFLTIPIGNVRNNTLIEIWKGGEGQKLRDIFDNNKNNEFCSNCNKNNVCNGGCIANRYYYSNDFNAKEPYCFIN